MTILQKHLVFVPLCFAVFAGALGGIAMLLWNWLIPVIFGLPTISFWQAVGLLALCRILFGGLGSGHHHHGHHGHGCACHTDNNRLRERWENMTPEERQRIVELHSLDVTCNTADSHDAPAENGQ